MGAAAIAALVAQLAPSLINLVSQAYAAEATNDQATLDKLLAQANAAADALAPK
jgi:hypothetical protein